MAPVHAPQETERLQALQSYAILDTPAEEAYDQLATLAARLCSTPMAVVNFPGSNRTSDIGHDSPHPPRRQTACWKMRRD